MYSSVSDPLATRWAPLALWWAALLYASLYPAYPWDWTAFGFAWIREGLPRWWTWPEVLVNVAAYLALGFLAARCLAPRIGAGLSVWLALVLGSLTSMAVELMQSALLPRIASVLDLMANSLGAFLGASFYLGLRAWLPALVLGWFRPWVDGVAFLWLLFWVVAQAASQVAPLGMGLLPYARVWNLGFSLPEPGLLAIQVVVAATGLTSVLILALSLGRSTAGRVLSGIASLVAGAWWLNHEWHVVLGVAPLWVWAAVVLGLLFVLISRAWRRGLAAKGLGWTLALHLAAVHLLHALATGHEQATEAWIRGQAWMYLEQLIEGLVILWPWMVLIWAFSVARLQARQVWRS